MSEGQSPARRERATMRDVAALAGVALKTVSRVVNGVSTVDPTLTQRVNEAMVKLGYRPNRAAASLRRGRTNTIGLVLEDVSNPFSGALCRAIEDAAWEHELLLFVVSVDENEEREREVLNSLIDRRVDGMIVQPAARDHRYLVIEQEAGVPFVFVDRPSVPLIADAVVTDNRAASTAAVRHLLDGGHTDIAYAGDDLYLETARSRFAGYADALRDARRPLRNDHIRHNLTSPQVAREAVSEMLTGDDRPDAIFSSQNLVTIGAIQAVHQLGLQNQVGLLGFDDIPLAETIEPGVTVVAQDIVGLGRMALQRLIDRMAGDDGPPQIHVVPSSLVERGSGELRRRTRPPRG